MGPSKVVNVDGQRVGTFLRFADTRDGEAMLIAREEQFGGGTIVVPAREASEADGAWRLPYGELSILEAPQYSPNVNLRAYLGFWERLGPGNYSSSASEFMPTGGGPVKCDIEVPDEDLRDAVNAALRDGEVAEGVAPHLVDVTVLHGTVLLEGCQNDTQSRLAAARAAASVPGVKEIVNMLVIRAY